MHFSCSLSGCPRSDNDVDCKRIINTECAFTKAGYYRYVTHSVKTCLNGGDAQLQIPEF